MTTNLHDVAVPDIGDFEEVDVIEVLVAIGDQVEVEQSLITLESDKATMEIPSPQAGVVRELLVEVGAKVSEGAVIVRLEVDEVRATDGEANETAKEVPPAAGPAGIGAAPPSGLLPADEHPVAVVTEALMICLGLMIACGVGERAEERGRGLGKSWTTGARVEWCSQRASAARASMRRVPDGSLRRGGVPCSGCGWGC